MRLRLLIIGGLTLGALWGFSGRQHPGPLSNVELLAKITAALNFFYSNYPGEKVFLHLDKPYYAAGSTIWFKAYHQLDNTYQADTAVSRVLYVDLLAADTLLAQRKLYLQYGSAWGDIGLPDYLPNGRYRLRAYTHFMRNFHPEAFHDQELLVINPEEPDQDPAAPPVPPPPTPYDFQLFPEGGHLVAGLRNVLAFKAVNAQGRGVPVYGEVLNQGGTVMARFRASHRGMGLFKLGLAPGQTYVARCHFPDSSVREVPLPPALDSGYVLSVEPLPDRALLRVRVLGQGMAPRPLSLLGHRGGRINFNLYDSSGRGFAYEVPTNLLPNGITHFTLFDDQGRPWAERLVFTNQQDTLSLKLGKDKPSYQRKQPAEITVLAADREGKPLLTDLSVAVVDADRVPLPAGHGQHNIHTYHLLSSELKGYLEDPAYYLQPGPGPQLAADLLMLTQGWRRFKWPALLAGQLAPPAYPREPEMRLAGRLLLANGRPLSGNPTVNLIAPKAGLIKEMTLGSKGEFAFDKLLFFDSATFTFQVPQRYSSATGVAGFTYNLRLDWETGPKAGPAPYPPGPWVSHPSFISQSQQMRKAERAFRLSKDARLLKTVTVTAKREPVGRERFASQKIYGTPDVSIPGRDLVNLAAGRANLLFALQGRVAGLTVGTDSTGQPNIVIRGIGSFRGSTTPLLLFNGMQVEIGFFASISPNDVDHVDVLKGPSASIYGARGGNGVIAVYGKDGLSDRTPDFPGSIINAQVLGYYLPREFYQPNHQNPSEEDKLMPDLRTTIYWNPNLQTDPQTGQASIRFFCADVPGRYRVTVMGRAANGQLGHKQMEFAVQ
ncbi:MAG: TonB-dependent receptor plug domain-containing protein [Bernardetiaceae bacterium]|nr:TonB-dependent receptor plug domain-containing protein [Bernardetiaceae bacterium]